MISLLFFLTRESSSLTWLKNSVLGGGPAICRAVLPNSQFHFLYDALICGATLPASAEKQLFIDTGLIHLMVVSGSHLVFLELLLGFLPREGRLGFLGVFCYLTGFQAPVVRAYLRRAIGPSVRFNVGVTSLQLEATTVAFALFLYPEWLFSRSFLMSWMCGLALCTPSLFKDRPYLDQALKCYAFLLPFCWASPLTVGWNSLLAPLVGVILFPICLLAVMIPGAVIVSDWVWMGFLQILAWGPKAPQFPLFVSTVYLCWVPLVVHSIFLVWEVRWRHAHAFLPLSRF